MTLETSFFETRLATDDTDLLAAQPVLGRDELELPSEDDRRRDHGFRPITRRSVYLQPPEHVAGRNRVARAAGDERHVDRSFEPALRADGDRAPQELGVALHATQRRLPRRKVPLMGLAALADVAADAFVRAIRSSAVMVNASSRFNDGGQLGLGAEIGISTTRLHAYGPMGAESLTIERFVVRGEGQLRQPPAAT